MSYMRFDQDMALPAWLALPPGASIVQASQSTYSNRPGLTASVQILARMQLDDLKRFFTDTLSAQGFHVTDQGLGAMDQRTATFLGVFGELTAERDGTSEWVRIQFRDEQGVIPTRFVQISWKLP